MDVSFDDGTVLQVMFKDLGHLLEGAQKAKPAFLYEPWREIATYRFILVTQLLGTATCYAAVVDRQAGRYWLFLERITGRELYQEGEIGVWQEAARWLAGLHNRFTDPKELKNLAATAHLPSYNQRFYGLWMERALDFARRRGPWSSQDQRGIDWLAGRYDRVIERLATLPATLIHGEFYASNILIQETAGNLRVCPVDWEMAAVGPGQIDLAALTAGAWSDAEKETIALAYHAALPANNARPAPKEFLVALDLCHLHLAVQWLGWSPDWKPPREHAQDWLREALRLADKLGL